MKIADKRTGYIVSIIIGILGLIGSMRVFQSINEYVAENGYQPKLGSFKLDASFLLSLLVIVSILMIVGGIGGIKKLKWGKALSLIGLVGYAVIQLSIGINNLLSALFGVGGALLVFILG
ncbi:hypothetical protein HYW54_03430 [Candidatus Gottesmanbacteria bacterium]|nr:hypothetical protein [Candidatus Gottesmanbacteria bacterium]